MALVDPRSPEAIASGITHLLDNPQEARVRIDASKTLALKNDCQLYLERFEQLLDRFEPIRRCWP